MDQEKQMTQKYEQFAVNEEIGDNRIVYNEATALVQATHKDIKVLIDLHEPSTERHQKRSVWGFMDKKLSKIVKCKTSHS